jgi:hypothetical protein
MNSYCHAFAARYPNTGRRMKRDTLRGSPPETIDDVLGFIVAKTPSKSMAVMGKKKNAKRQRLISSPSGRRFFRRSKSTREKPWIQPADASMNGKIRDYLRGADAVSGPRTAASKGAGIALHATIMKTRGWE